MGLQGSAGLPCLAAAVAAAGGIVGWHWVLLLFLLV
jgi:hypothetical protein